MMMLERVACVLLVVPSHALSSSSSSNPTHVVRASTRFRSYETPYLVSSATSQTATTALVFVHGFGSCGDQWRAMLDAFDGDKEEDLSGGVRAYALNLLGLGRAEKPTNETYSTALWAEQVASFARDVVQEDRVVLVGNSIGSLACLAAAKELLEEEEDDDKVVAGLALFNCAIGMNSKAKPDNVREMIEFPISWLAQPLFFLVDVILRNSEVVAQWLFDKVRDRDAIRRVLVEGGVYAAADRVDDALLDMFLEPAQDDGAREAFVAVVTGDPGPRPEALVHNLIRRSQHTFSRDDDDADDDTTSSSLRPQLHKSLPIGVFWGDRDPVTPIDGPVGRFFRRKAAEDSAAAASEQDASVSFSEEDHPSSGGVAFDFTVLPDTGHCPFDDRPELALAALRDWLQRYHIC